MDPRLDETHDVVYEERLALVVSRIMERVASGDSLELNDACHEHPEFAEDLRDLWGTIMLTEVAAAEQRGRIQHLDSLEAEGKSLAPLELPYVMNDFRLEEEIGRGGMGIVYRAVRLSNQEPVAIKVMLKGEFASSLDRQRFEAEAEAAAAINHPHVIPIYEIGEHQGLPRYRTGASQGGFAPRP